MNHHLLNSLLDEINGIGPIIDLKPAKYHNTRNSAPAPQTATSPKSTPPPPPTAPASTEPAPKTYDEKVAEWKKQIASAPRRYGNLPSDNEDDETGHSSKSVLGPRTKLSPKTKTNSKVKSMYNEAGRETPRSKKVSIDTRFNVSGREMHGRKGMTIGQHLAEFEEEDEEGNTFDDIVEGMLAGGDNAGSASWDDDTESGTKRAHEEIEISAETDFADLAGKLDASRPVPKRVRLSKPTVEPEAFSDEKNERPVRKAPVRKKIVVKVGAKSVGKKVKRE